MTGTIRILNKAHAGAVLPITNVRSYSDLSLLAQSGPLVVDDFALRIITSPFEVPAGSASVEYYLGIAPLYPLCNETAPFAMLLNQQLILSERQSPSRPPTAYFAQTLQLEPITVSSSFRTSVAQSTVLGGSLEWPHGLQCKLYCQEGYVSQADEVYFGRNYVDWNAWPNNTLMYWYVLRITGDRQDRVKFPALSVSLFGNFALSRGG